jgi:hypothetical protein
MNDSFKIKFFLQDQHHLLQLKEWLQFQVVARQIFQLDIAKVVEETSKLKSNLKKKLNKKYVGQ